MPLRPSSGNPSGSDSWRSLNDGTLSRTHGSAPGIAHSNRSPIGQWSEQQRLTEAAYRAATHLPADMRDEFLKLLTPEALGMMGAMIAVFAASQYFGVGIVIDLLLIAGIVMAGVQARAVADDVVKFYQIASKAKSSADLDRAGRHLAAAVSVVGVQLIVILITHRVGKAVGKTKAIIVTNAEVDAMLVRVLGSSKNVGKLPRYNVEKALRFFKKNNVSENGMVGALRGMDLHKPIATIKLPKGTRLVRFDYAIKDGQLSDGAWFTKAGTSERQLGLATGNRKFTIVELTEDVEVLSSKAAGINDTWTQGRNADVYAPQSGGAQKLRAGEMAAGGGGQYFVPGIKEKLLLIRQKP